MQSTLTTKLHSLCSQQLDTLREGVSAVDLQSVNIAAHARRHWGVPFHWSLLLDRAAAIRGDTLTVPELWDLQMITAAGQSPAFDPVACHTWSGCPEHLQKGSLRRLSQAFAAVCLRLFLERTSELVRRRYIGKLRELLSRIQAQCDAAQQEFDDASL